MIDHETFINLGTWTDAAQVRLEPLVPRLGFGRGSFLPLFSYVNLYEKCSRGRILPREISGGVESYPELIHVSIDQFRIEYGPILS